MNTMKQVTSEAIKELSNSECFSFHCKVDQIVVDVYNSLRLMLITPEEALPEFKRRIFNLKHKL